MTTFLIFWGMVLVGLLVIYVVLDRVVVALLRNKWMLVFVVLLVMLGVGLHLKGGF